MNYCFFKYSSTFTSISQAAGSNHLKNRQSSRFNTSPRYYCDTHSYVHTKSTHMYIATASGAV